MWDASPRPDVRGDASHGMPTRFFVSLLYELLYECCCSLSRLHPRRLLLGLARHCSCSRPLFPRPDCVGLDDAITV